MRAGETRFVPENWEKTYFQWLENIEPWCVSRQLWWGHQIPAWYAPDGSVYVAESEDEALAEALAQAVVKNEMTDDEARALASDPERAAGYLARDEDVLDTWFSSGLWPFSTLGWPDETPELKRYYPTSALVTGFDIIFFWVARMMMLGLHFMDEVPFRDVYIHALVRDERGAKMSKSKGNIIDPLELIDRYGADALRFTLAAQAAQGRDIKLSIQRVEGNRNFATKIWNAARFAEMNSCAHAPGFDPRAVDETLNRWILGETAKAVDEVTQGIVLYKFNEAAGAAYRFVWNVFCDWYLELAKPVLQGADGAAKDETRASVAFVLDQICKLLHPFMPFLTEELWASTSTRPLPGAFPSPLAGEGREGGRGDFAPDGATRADSSSGGSTPTPDPSPQGGGESSGPVLALAPWPALEGLIDEAAEAELGWVVELISEIRSARSETNVPAGAQIPLLLVNPSAAARARADALGRDHPPPCAPLHHHRRRERSAEFRAAHRARRGRSAAARRRRRPRGRGGAPRQGARQARRRHRQDRREARQCRFPRPCAGRDRRRAARAPRRRRGAPPQDRGGAGAAQRRHDRAGVMRCCVGPACGRSPKRAFRSPCRGNRASRASLERAAASQERC